VILNDKDRIQEAFRYTIWLFWDNPAMPIFVKKCIERIRAMNPEFKVIVLNFESLKNYLPDLTFEADDIPVANKTDVIRLELLYRYGGVWIDATVILFENLKWFIPHIEKQLYDCIAFARYASTTNPSHPVVESWFLCSHAGSPFIKRWLDCLKPVCKLGSKAYYEYLKSRDDYHEIVQNIDRPEYLLVYLACQIAMKQQKDYNLCLLSSEKTAFFYQEDKNWDIRKMYFELMFKKINPNGKLPLMVKLISGNYKDTDYCYSHGFINPKSIVGNVLYQKPYNPV
jgi:hypothetical protein